MLLAYGSRAINLILTLKSQKHDYRDSLGQNNIITPFLSINI